MGDDAQGLFEGPGSIATSIVCEAFGCEEDLACGGNQDVDTLHGSALQLDGEADRAIGQGLLVAEVALTSGLQPSQFDGVGLAQFVESFGQAPEAAEVVEEDLALRGQADGEAPAIELDAGALGDAVEKLDLAPGGQWQVQPPAGGLQRDGIFIFLPSGQQSAPKGLTPLQSGHQFWPNRKNLKI